MKYKMGLILIALVLLFPMIQAQSIYGDFGDLQAGDKICYQFKVSDNLTEFIQNETTIEKLNGIIDLLNISSEAVDYLKNLIQSFTNLTGFIEDMCIQFEITNITNPDLDFTGYIESNLSISGISYFEIYTFLTFIGIINQTETSYLEFLDYIASINGNFPIVIDFITALFDSEIEMPTFPLIIPNGLFDLEGFEEILEELYNITEVGIEAGTSHYETDSICCCNCEDYQSQSFDTDYLQIQMNLSTIAYLWILQMNFSQSEIEELFEGMDHFEDWLDCFHNANFSIRFDFEQQKGFCCKYEIGMNLSVIILKFQDLFNRILEFESFPEENLTYFNEVMDYIAESTGYITLGLYLDCYIGNRFSLTICLISIFAICLGLILLFYQYTKSKKR